MAIELKITAANMFAADLANTLRSMVALPEFDDLDKTEVLELASKIEAIDMLANMAASIINQLAEHTDDPLRVAMTPMFLTADVSFEGVEDGS